MAYAPPIILDFSQGSNKVVQLLTSAPGTVFARLIDFDLGTGGVTYAPLANDRSAIYNPIDDSMYFLAEKTVSMVTTQVLVQYSPRTLAVVADMELPAGWDTANSVLVDVADDVAWITSSFDGTMRAFSLPGFAEIFTDGGDFGSAPFSTPSAAIAADSGHLLLADSVDPLTFHRITITSATTYDDDTGTTAGAPVWANNGSYRRRWIATNNKVIVTYEGGGPGIGAIIDVAALTVAEIALPGGWVSGNLSNNGIFWDPFILPVNVFVGSVNFNDGSPHTGIAVFGINGTLVGVAALDATDWNTASPAMPLGGDVSNSVGMVFSESFLFAGGGAGGFSVVAPTTTPFEEYEANSFTSTPTGLSFDAIQSCIALSRTTGPVTPGMTTVASAGGTVGTTLTDSATLSGGDDPTGTITFFLFGPNDGTCALEPIFTSDPITVTGNGTYVSSPGYIPVVMGTYRWTAVYSGDDNNDPIETECNAVNETSIITEVSPPQGGGASPGNCGVQFERLELFHMLKSLMGGGRTLKEALKFVDQDDIDFLEEEGYMEELPQEIVKPMRQGGSPKMVNRRIDLAPMNQLNKLIDEFETKLQDCVHRSVGEYEK